MISSGFRRGASFIASAKAWELSNAGRMPSSRASMSNALEGLVVAGAGVRRPAGVFPIAVLRAGAGIVQSGRNAVDVAGLAVVVLEHVAEAAVQHAGPAEAERGGVVAGLGRSPARLDAHQGHALVGNERIEHAGGVAASADAGHDHVGQPADLLPGTAGASRGR